MTYRKRTEWPPHVRQMLLDDVRLDYEAAEQAEARFKIRVYLAVEQGLTTREVGEALGISQAAASRYRIQGEAAYRERQAEG